ncbi:hypothetical protein GIB67_000052 [Kingdonia uniflora]|uniref:DUF7913 domain-containing protein n=1 Tax=Kingdonia uniflora TaxID=39325 RepID=A0A7J7NBZ6_9MAGN|nr:hypothetical protein GIB67_000052 [Kingdonia uniflora]
MLDRDTVAWNVLISCYVRNGRTRDAFSLFDVMQRPENGCKPDNVTCLLLLQGSAQLCGLSFGERVHDYVEEHGYGKSVKICNSLIAMYARCRCVDKVVRVFRGMLVKDVVTWTLLITGLAINGQGRDAIEAFTEMQRRGIHPDVQTFTGYTCSIAATKDVIQALKEHLVQPLLPTKPKVIETLLGTPEMLEIGKVFGDLARFDVKMHAVVLLYNYYHIKVFPKLEYLDGESFCKVVVNAKQNLLAFMKDMSTLYIRAMLENQFSIIEQEIVDACNICTSLDAPKVAPRINEWPVSKIAILLTDST